MHPPFIRVVNEDNEKFKRIETLNRFYNEDCKRTKIDFFNELKNPKFLKDHMGWDGMEKNKLQAI